MLVAAAFKSRCRRCCDRLFAGKELFSMRMGRCLQEQLRVALAGRAAERLLLGEDEVSSLSMENINQARNIVHMLVLGGAMSDNPYIGPRMISQPHLTAESSNEVEMYIGKGTSVQTLTVAQFEMQEMLKEVAHYMHVWCVYGASGRH
jgi:ATP-dependent Zn protease